MTLVIIKLTRRSTNIGVYDRFDRFYRNLNQEVMMQPLKNYYY